MDSSSTSPGLVRRCLLLTGILFAMPALVKAIVTRWSLRCKGVPKIYPAGTGWLQDPPHFLENVSELSDVALNISFQANLPVYIIVTQKPVGRRCHYAVYGITREFLQVG